MNDKNILFLHTILTRSQLNTDNLIIEVSLNNKSNDENDIRLQKIKRKKGKRIKLELVIRSPGFEIKGTNTRVIRLQNNYRFPVIKKIELIPCVEGEQEVIIDCYQDENKLGSLIQKIYTQRQKANEAYHVTSSMNNPPIIIQNTHEALPPDLNLVIKLDENDEKTLNFTLYSIKSELDYHHKNVGKTTLKKAPEEKIKSVYKKLGVYAELSPRQGKPINLGSSVSSSQNRQKIAEDKLMSVGHELWDELIPQQLKQEYWKFEGQVKSLLITSDEPWIPWEIIKPDDPDTERIDSFWCEKFALSRWIQGGGMADYCTAESITTIASNTSDLPNIDREIDFLRNLNKICAYIDCNQTMIDGLDIKKHIAEKRYSILHFACHGSFNDNSPNDSDIQLTGYSLSPADIRVRYKNLRPIVFINACNSAKSGFNYTKIGGWAERFVNSKVGVFIGAMWEVNDELAFQFAKTFYIKLLKENLTVAEAFQKSREVIRDAAPYNSTWLAYSLYANPQAKIKYAS